MNAKEFIKQYGWDEAKRIMGMSRKHGKSGLHYSLSDELYYGASMNDRISVDDLKQFVDAWELVEKRGGLSEAKAIEQQYWNSGVGSAMIVAMELKQAIELVESVNENN